MMIKVGFVKLENYPENIEVEGKMVAPTWQFAHKGDACADIYAAKLTILDVNDTKVIPTGVKLEIPEGYEVVIRPRSGMTKKGLFTQIGTIDSNYKGEIGVSLHNASGMKKIIQRGERIGQVAIRKTENVSFVVMDESELTDSERGDKGFGSTGK